MDNLLDYDPINEIIFKLRVRIKYYNLTLITQPQTKKHMQHSKKNFTVFFLKSYVIQFPIMTWIQY
jgi:hypothetical protein